ncbi:hypothetical protein SLA2020_322000 [Shorea laevis]
MVWKAVLHQPGVTRRPQPWNEEAIFILETCRGGSIRASEIQLAIACSGYRIWQERNQRVFQQKTKDPKHVSCHIIQVINLAS